MSICTHSNLLKYVLCWVHAFVQDGVAALLLHVDWVGPELRLAWVLELHCACSPKDLFLVPFSCLIPIGVGVEGDSSCFLLTMQRGVCLYLVMFVHIQF